MKFKVGDMIRDKEGDISQIMKIEADQYLVRWVLCFSSYSLSYGSDWWYSGKIEEDNLTKLCKFELIILGIEDE